jgi:hypothetical protein
VDRRRGDAVGVYRTFQRIQVDVGTFKIIYTAKYWYAVV